MTHVAEIVTFTLADGTTPEQFVGLSRASEAFVRAAPGFALRRLSQGQDGRWTDYVVWSDMKSAHDAAAEFSQQPFAAGMMAAINPDSLQMRHETVLWTLGT